MYKARIYITLKESVLDPQGSAVLHSLHSLSFQAVDDVRIGKFIEVTLSPDEGEVTEQVEQMCNKLLANPVIENYRYDIEEVQTS